MSKILRVHYYRAEAFVLLDTLAEVDLKKRNFYYGLDAIFSVKSLQNKICIRNM